MLVKSILGYAPANLAPALAAVITIVAFTRLLPPEDFGRFALAQAVILFGQAAAFFALQVSVTRFFQAHAASTGTAGLMASAYACYFVCAAAAAAVFALIVTLLSPEPALAAVLWAALPVLLLRGLVYVNLAAHRGAGRVGRFTLVEVAQSLGGVAAALALVAGFGFGPEGMILGLLVGTLVALAVDWRLLLASARGKVETPVVRQLFGFGAPLVAAHALNAGIAYVDRVFVERLLGAAALGVYAAAFAVVERAVSLVFMAVTLGAYPLAIKALETDGREAAIAQHGRNATALLALGVPSAVGLAVCAPQIAAVLVGEEYRAGAAALMPWVAALALLRGLSQHYLDQALHLGKRTDLFMRTLLPAAAVSLALTPTLLLAAGLPGALIAALCAQATATALTARYGAKVFGLAFPWAQAGRVSIAAGVMAAAVLAVPLDANAVGFATALPLGATVYALAALALDVAGSRGMALAWIKRRSPAEDKETRVANVIPHHLAPPGNAPAAAPHGGPCP